MLIEVRRWQVRCEDCGRGAGELRETDALALYDALLQGGYYHHEHGGECYWVCPQCVAVRQSEGKPRPVF